MPQPRKPADRRQGYGTNDVTILREAPLVTVPEPPFALSEVASGWYRSFWTMEAAKVADPITDGPVISRWAVYMADWERCNTAIQEEGTTTTGSQGQTVQHPLFRQRDELEARISAIEQRLGLDPKSRATLGISVNQYKKSAFDLMTDIQNQPPVALEDDNA